MESTPCRFFAYGACNKGQACTYSHEFTTSNSGPAATGLLLLQPVSSRLQPFPLQRHEIPCRFYALGSCKKGADCLYQHPSTPALVTGLTGDSRGSFTGHVADANVQRFVNGPKTTSLQLSEYHNLKGAHVKFGPGAKVADVELLSDYSAVQISCLQPNCSAEQLQGYLYKIGEGVPLACIHIKRIPVPNLTLAIIKVKNPDFAKDLKAKVDSRLERHFIPHLNVWMLDVKSTNESTAAQLQLGSVICSWYKPSRYAWLHYDNEVKATDVADFINARQFKISGHMISATLEPRYQDSGVGVPGIMTVKVLNLDLETTSVMILRHLPEVLKPISIVFGHTSYPASIQEANCKVRSILQTIGPLESWEVDRETSTSHVRATARFRSADDARRAISKFNEVKIPTLGNTKLSLRPLVSVLFDVPLNIYSAIGDDIGNLQRMIWDAGRVRLKVYSPWGPAEHQVSLQLQGENAAAVAKAKGALERILIGEVAMNGDVKIWDSFFATPEGLYLLEQIALPLNAYVHRDMRKRQLSLFGCAGRNRQMENSLLDKLTQLRANTLHAVLSPGKAPQVLFRHVLEALGKEKVKLELRRGMMAKIIILGDMKDWEVARRLMNHESPNDLTTMSLKEDIPNDANCAICWSKDENSYRTPCNHTYCKPCLAHQCLSPSPDTFPLRCLGAGTKCNDIFTLEDLEAALPYKTFEQTLENSLETHIRTHSDELQYCPTPDCPSIYRPTTTGRVITCFSCLMPICTTCHTTAHNDMTCTAYQQAVKVKEDIEALNKWKKEHNVKDCPKCGASIEKRYGCHHIQCGNCETHICWFCMGRFETAGECYGHMDAGHDGDDEQSDDGDGGDEEDDTDEDEDGNGEGEGDPLGEGRVRHIEDIARPPPRGLPGRRCCV